MAQGVVHGLEVVEIDEEDGEEWAGRAPEPRDAVPDSVKEKRAVGETGERVVQRALMELLIQTPVLDRHRRLERETPGESKSPLVDRAALRGGELRDPDGFRVGDERKQHHELAAETLESGAFHYVALAARDL